MGAILRRDAKMSELRNTMPPAALSRLVMGPIRSRPEGTSRPKGPARRVVTYPQNSNRGRSTMHMKVMAEQFMLQGDKLIHAPTGATFWLGDKDVECCEQGHLNLETGDDYKLDELKDEAWRIMAAERKGA